jgi:hypothetical protein
MAPDLTEGLLHEAGLGTEATKILKLKKVLYGLRRSSLLWQKAFIAMILVQLGFNYVASVIYMDPVVLV